MCYFYIYKYTHIFYWFHVHIYCIYIHQNNFNCRNVSNVSKVSFVSFCFRKMSGSCLDDLLAEPLPITKYEQTSTARHEILPDIETFRSCFDVSIWLAVSLVSFGFREIKCPAVVLMNAWPKPYPSLNTSKPRLPDTKSCQTS